MKAKRNVLPPRRARTFEAICDMPRDNVGSGDFWMITDGYHVTLARQKTGEAPTQTVSVPREVFDAFADWYATGRWRAPRKRRAEATDSEASTG